MPKYAVWQAALNVFLNAATASSRWVPISVPTFDLPGFAEVSLVVLLLTQLAACMLAIVAYTSCCKLKLLDLPVHTH